MNKYNIGIISDRAEFGEFEKGKLSEVAVFVFPENENELNEGDEVEIYLTSNRTGYPHHTATIVKNLGVLPSIPEGKPELVAVQVVIKQLLM